MWERSQFQIAKYSIHQSCSFIEQFNGEYKSYKNICSRRSKCLSHLPSAFISKFKGYFSFERFCSVEQAQITYWACLGCQEASFRLWQPGSWQIKPQVLWLMLWKIWQNALSWRPPQALQCEEGLIAHVVSGCCQALRWSPSFLLSLPHAIVFPGITSTSNHWAQLRSPSQDFLLRKLQGDNSGIFFPKTNLFLAICLKKKFLERKKSQCCGMSL